MTLDNESDLGVVLPDCPPAPCALPKEQLEENLAAFALEDATQVSATRPTGQVILNQWFDELGAELRQRATRAGLMGHPTLTGDAREFFVKEVLQSFLPDCLSVGTGRVFGANHAPSKQVDVVVYDSRYPALRIKNGTAMYPIEGVIATIEVKSRLDATELRGALDNCLSVMRIPVMSITRDYADAMRSLERVFGSPESVKHHLEWSSRPRTFIFGFDGLKTPDAVQSVVTDWIHENGKQGSGNRLYLPSAIATSDIVGLALGEHFTVAPSSISPELHGKAAAMMFYPGERQFAWVAALMLACAEDRILFASGDSSFRPTIRGYLNFESLINQDLSGGELPVSWIFTSESSDPD
ncbi:MAG: hypothetical protein KDA16_01535 [Phycisphaerales bacterium]|nr:hypothetical protein [Phycisphaerales bacterium]